MLLIFDGDCALCCRWAEWLKRKADGRVEVVASQVADLSDLGLTGAQVDSSVWLVRGDERLAGHQAIGAALVEVGGVWKVVGFACLVPPTSWVARGVYWVIARNRRRIGCKA